MNSTQFTIVLDHIECGDCGVHFGLTRQHHKAVRASGKSFYCPKGHRICYSDTEVARLKRKLEYEEACRSRAEGRAAHEERRAAAYKGHLTRTKNRIKNGVCPCCNRQFKNLQRHMASQHPDYVACEGGVA